jgi:hypothetical protein
MQPSFTSATAALGRVGSGGAAVESGPAFFMSAPYVCERTALSFLLITFSFMLVWRIPIRAEDGSGT